MARPRGCPGCIAETSSKVTRGALRGVRALLPSWMARIVSEEMMAHG